MKVNWEKVGLAAIVALVVVLIYHGWFNTRMLARGDWSAKSPAWMRDYLGAPSVWNEAYFGSAPQVFGGALVKFPLFHLQAQLHKIFGFDFALTERIIWFFPFLIFSTLSIYLLAKYLFKHTLVSFFATIYFIANNFIIFRLHGAQLNLAMVYALTPLGLYLFIRGLKEKKIFFAFLWGIVSSLMVWYEPRITIISLALQGSYGLYYVFVLASERRDSFKTLAKNLLIGGVVLLLFNIFWLLPFAIDFQAATPSGSGFFSLDTVKSLSRTKFFDALVLSIGADSRWKRFIYLDGQIITAALFPIILIVYGASFLAKPRKDYLFWILASFGLAFMAKGLNPPLSRFNFFFYNYVPLASMYRLPSKFLMVGGTAISLCFGLGCAGILAKIRDTRWRASVFATLVFLPILVLLPALFGSKSLKSTAGGSSFNPFVAPAYFEFEEWLNQQDDNHKSVSLPGTPRYCFFSRQHPLYGPPPLNRYKTTSFESYYRYRFRTLNGLQSFENKVLPEALRLLGIKCIFLAPQEAGTWASVMKGTRGLMEKALLEIDAFRKVGDQDIFVIEGDPAPRFYLSHQLVHIDGDFEEVIGSLIDSGVDLQAITLVDEKVPDAVSSNEAGFFGRLGEVEFEKLGNSKYKIKIFDPPEGGFYLNFQDNYDSNWGIDEAIKPSLSALGTNYFLLENNGEKPHLELILEHRLQKYLDLGWRVTQISWVLVGGIILCKIMKRLIS